ncbi:conserved hypothetical protein [Luminiphilus syltensis NOR5-1B]|uniref:Ubiquinone biosynthesis accessory factor UbiK n=1 Tax=Luminiphilus syltensis NOR5-1B TaxID=565045 RepID=B8KSV9_9GAMM|nr:accessory factor UbiK family protein [Luminiphilus syltensis]EED34405.1 conserved hypothetical protein [Luminiphilus syltensis NOR5-1B]
MSNQYDQSQGRRPGLGDLFGRVLDRDNPVIEQLDRNARSLAQSALAKLDVVSRAEFDAQTEVLRRTRQRVEELEQTLDALTARVENNQTPTD